jgi:hypothetical protein
MPPDTLPTPSMLASMQPGPDQKALACIGTATMATRKATATILNKFRINSVLGIDK